MVALVIDTEEKAPRKPTVQRMRRMHVLLKSQTNQNQVPARQEKRSLCAGAGLEICFRVLFGVLCVYRIQIYLG